MFNWDVFGAGLAIVLIALLLQLTKNTLIDLFSKILGTEASGTIPEAVYWALYVIGFGFMIGATGLFTSFRLELLDYIKHSNVPELFLGIGLVIVMGYSGTRKAVQENLGIGFLGSSILFVFGTLLVLDALAIIPIFSGLSFLIQSIINKTIAFISVYPGMGLLAVAFATIMVVIGGYFLIKYVSKRSV